MKYRKELTTTIGTVACAIGIGFFMQQSGSVPSPEYQGATLANADAAILDVEEIILTSAEFTDDFVAPRAEEAFEVSQAQEIVAPQADALPDLQVAAMVDSAELPNADIASEQILSETPCEVSVTARAVAAAMVSLEVSAPCMTQERLTVHHAGMLFSEVTDDDGALALTVPAMAEDATFIVAFSNGEGAVAQTTVEELSDFDRVVLQWKGDKGFQIHAREFGADYGSEGHVWSGSMRDITYAVTGEGGFLSRLGRPDMPNGLVAEIYTFPVQAAQNGGGVTLSVEAEVASNNCGLEIEAQALQTFSGKDITSRDLTLSVPDCDAAGNFLVLNSLFEDLKVAALN